MFATNSCCYCYNRAFVQSCSLLPADASFFIVFSWKMDREKQLLLLVVMAATIAYLLLLPLYNSQPLLLSNVHRFGDSIGSLLQFVCDTLSFCSLFSLEIKCRFGKLIHLFVSAVLSSKYLSIWMRLSRRTCIE